LGVVLLIEFFFDGSEPSKLPGDFIAMALRKDLLGDGESLGTCHSSVTKVRGTVEAASGPLGRSRNCTPTSKTQALRFSSPISITSALRRSSCEWRSGQIPNTATGVGRGEDWRSQLSGN
jgi:hypothetical protein